MDRDQLKYDGRTLEHLKRVRATFIDEVEMVPTYGPLGVQDWQRHVARHPHAGASDAELLMLHPMPQ
ncbi:hypothetical protein [Paraburkholderia lycopersici]|uniref:hypothetical protein n=1 Tax=Paraburkholderia lycopersici TaxID=416944 RepID=UPI000B880F15|nr:hypothetical protein [Paraburkholderia lycopersici]